MLTLSGIYIYPVKSLRGIALDACKVGELGFQYDRRWMLVNADGRFITQRQQPRMALISVVLEAESLRLEAPAMEALHIPYDIADGDSIQVTVWKDQCQALWVGEEYDRWFSRFLGIECRLVYMPESSRRQVDQCYAPSVDDRVSFADGFPFLLISEASLADLNQRMNARGAASIPMARFRPNLVVSGCAPYAEDEWHKIQVGDLQFHVVKPCSRCIIPTIDIETGERAKEPLQTLMGYRKRNNEIYFGQNLVHEIGDGQVTATLRLGEAIELLGVPNI